MKRLLFINDTTDHDNWGSIACTDALKEIIQETSAGIEIIPLYSEWIKRRYRVAHIPLLKPFFYHKPNKVLNRFSKAYPYIPQIYDEFEHVANDWLSGKAGPGAEEFIEKVKDVDTVLFNAEGSVYRNNYTAILGLFLLWLAKNKFNKKAFFHNGSVTLTRIDPRLPAIVKHTFESLDGISIREPYSLRNFQKFCPDIEATLIPDSVFYFQKHIDKKLSEATTKLPEMKEGYFCFSLSMLPMGYKRNPDHSSIVKMINEVKKVVPQAVLMAKDGSDTFLREAAKKTNSLYFGPENTYADLLKLLQHAQFVITGRYHHTIMASMVGCPTIPLTTTSHKIEGLCELLDNIIGSPIDATDIFSNLDNITTRAKSYTETRPALKEKLLRKTEEIAVQTLHFGKMMI